MSFAYAHRSPPIGPRPHRGRKPIGRLRGSLEERIGEPLPADPAPPPPHSDTLRWEKQHGDERRLNRVASHSHAARPSHQLLSAPDSAAGFTAERTEELDQAVSILGGEGECPSSDPRPVITRINITGCPCARRKRRRRRRTHGVYFVKPSTGIWRRQMQSVI